MSSLDELVPEATRQFTVCNACRYCEGYCAVFPALERRATFDAGDLAHLAHVCHDCRACSQACMYGEPHEFAINIPALMSSARVATYAEYSRPRWAARILSGGPRAAMGITVVVVAIVFGAFVVDGTLAHLTREESGAGALYRLIPHLGMMIPALTLTALALLVTGRGLIAARAAHGRAGRLNAGALWRAGAAIATLRWQGGGGGGCYYPSDGNPSGARRRLHHLVAYGFGAAFAATIAAWIEETFAGVEPPYRLLSAPVILGSAGGGMLIVGCIGLLLQKRSAPAGLADVRGVQQDYALLLSLLLVAVSGVLSLLVRDTSATGIVTAIHLGAVFALFLLLPYGKLVHAAYRIQALVQDELERSGHE